MTKEELKSILKQFEYDTSCKRMTITEFHNTYVVCKFEELVPVRCPWDPADIDIDVEEVVEKVNLLDIANSIDEMPSAYWHTVAMDIKEWYSLHKAVKDLQYEYNKLNSRIDNNLIPYDVLEDALYDLGEIQGQLDLYNEELYKFTHNK